MVDQTMLLALESPVRQHWMPTEQAIEQYLAYEERYGRSHAFLACHAAFPLIVTPELVNLIRINFLADQVTDWVAEADFLLTFCHPLDMGQDLYMIDPGLREVMLSDLQDSDYGIMRLYELGDFLLAYIERYSERLRRPDIAKVHQWLALSYLYPQKLIDDMKAVLLAEGDDVEVNIKLPMYQLHVATMVEVMHDTFKLGSPILEERYQELIKTSHILLHYWYQSKDKRKIPTNSQNQVYPGMMHQINQKENIQEKNTANITPKSILYIDNDPHMVRSVPRLLKLAGYEVVVAQRVEDALHTISHKLFQLAIMGIRNQDDHNSSDKSGFMLARQLPPTVPFLFYTSDDTKENIHEALGQVGAYDIIAKDDPEATQKLLTRVDELFHTSVGVNFDLIVEHSPDLNTIAGQLPVADDDIPQPTAQDVMLILRRLFREAEAIQLTPLLTRGLMRTSTLLFIVQERRPQGKRVPVVLKLGDATAIAAEAEAYHQIKAFLGGQRRTQLEGEAYSRAVGGLFYSLIGAAGTERVQPLAALFVTQPAARVVPLLERFFQTTFGQIHADAQPATLDLMEHYTEQLHLTAVKLQQAAQALDPALLTSPTLYWAELPRPLPNPLYRVLQGNALRSFGALATHTCLCHGDLHSHNILVDDEQHFWLIDFARTTVSHCLRDFAELETDIKFRALPPQPLADFIAFESALVAPAVWEEEPTAILLPMPLQQAFDLITALRRIARQQLAQAGAVTAYQQALFWHTLNVVRLKTVEPARKRQAIVSAALLIERLSND